MNLFRRFPRWLLLLSAAAVLPFCMGANTVALAAWVGPVLLLGYTRSISRWWEWPLVWGIQTAVWLFQFRGMVPMPAPGPVIVGGFYALLAIIPYAIDRWASRSQLGFASTLVFPAALTAVDFGSSFSPYGSWGAYGYSQYGVLPLMQLCSITGLYGLSFLLGWFASMTNWAWENRAQRAMAIRGVAFYGAVALLTYVGGVARMQLAADPVRTARVVGLTPDHAEYSQEERKFFRQFWSGQPLSAGELAELGERLNVRLNRLFERSENEARAGAKLVFWSEGAGLVLRDDEPAMIAKGAELARRNQLHLGITVASLNPATRKQQNKTILIGPDGRVAFEYWKSRLVPGSEAMCTEQNGNAMGTAETELGRVGAFICFDFDFPSLIRQAGRAGVDILLAPSNDWKAIDPWHTQMAAFRAVENGCSLVRATGSGRSLAVDRFGRSLGESDDFNNPVHSLVAFVPTRGGRTVYSVVGDTFAWLCVAGVVLLPVLPSARARRIPTASGRDEASTTG